MKEGIKIISFLTLLLPISTTMVQGQMQTYTDLTKRFTIDYPLGWKIIQLPADSQGSSTVIFINPGGRGESINVVLAPGEAQTALTMGLEEYTKMQIDQLLSTDKDVNIVEDVDCQKYHIQSHKACSHTVSTEIVNSESLYLMQLLTVGKQDVYVFTYTSLARYFDSNLQIFNKMIKSFKITEKGEAQRTIV